MWDRFQSIIKVHREKGRCCLLFCGDSCMNFESFKPVHDLLMQDPRIQLFYSSHLKDFSKIKTLYEICGIAPNQIIDEQTARKYSFDMFLTPIRFCQGQNSRIKVKLVHGVSFKGKHYKRAFKKFDYLFCPGNFLKRIYQQLDDFEENDPRLVLTGFPKDDGLLDGSLDRAQLMQQMGLNASLPVVLFAPTWGKGNALERLGLEIVQQIQQLPVQLLIQLHEHDKAWKKPLEKVAASNVHFSENSDSSHCLFVSDLLISDASSVANEFTLLDRPIVFVDVPDLLSNYPDNYYFKNWGRQAGPVVDNIEDLLLAVKKGLDQPQEMSEIRQRIANDLFHKPGHSAILMAHKIYQLLDMTPPESLQASTKQSGESS